jgi:DNA-binding response OmpR family regulator
MDIRVLVVDDEEWVCDLVGRYLRQAGYEVATAMDGTKAIAKFESFRPDLVILDWMLPGIDGLSVAGRIRAQSSTPIIMLTARADEMDRIEGLDAGVDDYVVKPFSARELEVRVRTVLRRAGGGATKQTLYEFGDIRLDTARHEVKVAGENVDLTPMEFDLLAFLLEHPGHVFTRLELLEAVRGTTYESFARTIDSHVKRLRQKIEPDPARPQYVQTVFGIGYKLASIDEHH